jgi:hydrogenase nickel incorporation protein HypA/HybF
MHELSIAQNIAKIVMTEYKRGKFTEEVKKIFFSAGKMNAIIPETLVMNFDCVKKEYQELQQAELILEEKPVIIQCQVCQEKFCLESPEFICPECGAFDIKIIQGKDMYVDSFEI